MEHTHSWFTEQQTGHTFCQACGKHPRPDPDCPDQPSALWTMLQDPAYVAALNEIIDQLSPRAQRFFGRVPKIPG